MSIKDYFFYHKKKFVTVILFVVILVGGFFLYKVYAKELNYSKEVEKRSEKEEIKSKKEEKEEKNDKNIEEYVVDIKGEVVNPGIYKASKTDRVIDIIRKAGGLTRNADTYYLNLSQKIVDQMLIRVNSKYEVNLNRELELKEKETINTASKDELKNIPYITEQIANLIIERRNKNPFRNLEELLEIKGIKENTLAKIKEIITL